MRENTDQKNSEYGHFLRSDNFNSSEKIPSDLDKNNQLDPSSFFHYQITFKVTFHLDKKIRFEYG